MAIITKEDLNRIVGSVSRKDLTQSERFAENQKTKRYDVFLSHSYLDKTIIYQLNALLEDKLGLDVYVDWIENPLVDRSSVTAANAKELRDVMGRCDTTLYATSVNASTSTWMPWELGYSDAKHGKVAVLPVADAFATIAAYKTQQFVGLYPYIDLAAPKGATNQILWVNDPDNSLRYRKFSEWKLDGQLKDNPQ